jgi:hypothetical protein
VLFDDMAHNPKTIDKWHDRLEPIGYWFKRRVDIYDFKIRGWFL